MSWSEAAPAIALAVSTWYLNRQSKKRSTTVTETVVGEASQTRLRVDEKALDVKQTVETIPKRVEGIANFKPASFSVPEKEQLILFMDKIGSRLDSIDGAVAQNSKRQAAYESQTEKLSEKAGIPWTAETTKIPGTKK